MTEQVQGPVGPTDPRPIKYMDIQEFRDGGFLQEANRQFFHPLGLALEVTSEDGVNFWLSGVWDYREDPEGMIFGDRPDGGKAQNVRVEKARHDIARRILMGSTIQPLGWDPVLTNLDAHGEPMGSSPHTE